MGRNAKKLKQARKYKHEAKSGRVGLKLRCLFSHGLAMLVGNHSAFTIQECIKVGRFCKDSYEVLTEDNLLSLQPMVNLQLL